MVEVSPDNPKLASFLFKLHQSGRTGAFIYALNTKHLNSLREMQSDGGVINLPNYAYPVI